MTAPDPAKRAPDPLVPAHQSHPRTFLANRYVYAVLSRRAGGVSIGVNLSPHKACNFNCTYCQVDRTTPGPEKTVVLSVLRDELRATLELVKSDALLADPRFRSAPQSQRRVVDIAFSGDGEPTVEPWFPEAAHIAAEERKRAGLSEIAIRVITNATVFHLPRVSETLRFLDAHALDVWAKLDAGTAAYYDEVDRTRVPFQRVIDNITACARERLTTIQTLFARHHGAPPTSDEVRAWAGRLADIAAAGGRIGWVQVHTVSRAPGESFVTPLTMDELDQIAALAQAALPKSRVVAYRGSA